MAYTKIKSKINSGKDYLCQASRAQVGIGTLIIFIAMVLVAAISAGILINTAGIFQSKSEQTGKESSKQVTNQLQIISKTGLVSNKQPSSSEILVLGIAGANVPDGGDPNGTLVVDSSTTLNVTVTASGLSEVPKVILTTKSNNGELVLGNNSIDNGLSIEAADERKSTNKVTVTRLTTDSGTERVRLTNEDTGASILFNAGDTLVLQDAPATNRPDREINTSDGANPDSSTVDVTFSVKYNDRIYGRTVANQTAEVPDLSASQKSGYEIPTVAETRTRSYLQLVSGLVSGNIRSSGTVRLSDGETMRVTEGGTLVNENGNELSISDEDVLTFDINVRDKSFKVTNENTGSAITVASNGGLGVPGDSRVFLRDGSQTIKLDNPNPSPFFFRTLSSIDDRFPANERGRYLFTRDIRSEKTVIQVDLVVAGSAGADDINMRQAVISARTPEGSVTLNYGKETVKNKQFTITAVKDEDDTAPVLTSGDQFEINLDFGDLKGGDTVELRITTSSKATKVVQLRVPDPVSKQGAVGL